MSLLYPSVVISTAGCAFINGSINLKRLYCVQFAKVASPRKHSYPFTPREIWKIQGNNIL
jgi:hypothetical protein